MRGSDPDAALYYLARMLDAGEDPLFLARRVVRMAVEDIGLADPQALVVANAAKDAYDFLGSPEGELAIAQAVIYVATAPKSNAAYKAFGAAMRTAKEAGSLLPPKAHPQFADQADATEGYGTGYEYDHDTPEAFSGQDYFPEALGPADILRSARARLRARDQEAPRLLGQARASGAGSQGERCHARTLKNQGFQQRTGLLRFARNDASTRPQVAGGPAFIQARMVTVPMKGASSGSIHREK